MVFARKARQSTRGSGKTGRSTASGSGARAARRWYSQGRLDSLHGAVERREGARPRGVARPDARGELPRRVARWHAPRVREGEVLDGRRVRGGLGGGPVPQPRKVLVLQRRLVRRALESWREGRGYAVLPGRACEQESVSKRCARDGAGLRPAPPALPPRIATRSRAHRSAPPVRGVRRVAADVARPQREPRRCRAPSTR